ncbi:MerR family transcriptional regulator [Yoonia sp. 2307UL14-13]|uniref:MerR family transcriptional regulator n=1 Tax=Yoonia sp. 2307UL14-13 TaxID=3126506 RepID=UPI003098ECBD
MAKAKDAFRTISEVAEWLETPTHVLRFWESKFSQIKPVKGAGGRRYYRPTDMDLLGGIKYLLHEQGMTIKGTQKLLREKGVKHVASLGLSMTVPEPALPPAEKPIPEPKPAPPKKAAAPTPEQDTLPFDDHQVPDTPQIDWPAFPDEIDNLPARSFGVISADGSGRNAAQLTPLVARLHALRNRMRQT